MQEFKLNKKVFRYLLVNKIITLHDVRKAYQHFGRKRRK